jgi:two-component system, cell cycle sensor histidine kinase and response regulator CckA
MGHSATVSKYQLRHTQSLDAGSPSTGRGKTILLVEDEKSFRQYAALALERLGYIVLKAANGQSALEISSREADRIDLLLTDLNMPDMDGQDLAIAIGRRFPEIKVLFLSGYTADAAIRRGDLQAGAPFLQKPFEMFALAEAIRELLVQI